MKKFLDVLMWIVFFITFVAAAVTMLAVFGVIYWNEYIKYFERFYILELCLTASFYMWGINNLFNSYTRNNKRTFLLSIIFGSILLIFFKFGIY